VEQFSAAGCTNLTIHDPIVIDEPELLKALPPSTTTEGCIRKLRVVERADGLFSICPIFYPAVIVPEDVREAVRASAIARALLGDYDQTASTELLERALFQIASLIASAHLLRTVSAFLEPLQLADKLTIKAPDESLRASVLSHLAMLFPLMEAGAVKALLGPSLAYRQRWSKQIRGDRQRVRIDAGIGTSGERKVAEFQWRLLRDSFSVTEHDPARAAGLTWDELVDRIVGAPTLVDTGTVALLSAALDKAIDEADIVTDVAIRKTRLGERRLVRVFRPDGEMVTADLRRVCALWKKDDPPPTGDV
jgi:hypothetical protein